MLKFKGSVTPKKYNIFTDIKQLSDNVITFFNNHNFTKDHFIRGTYFNHFTKNLQYSEPKKWIPSTGMKKNIIEDIWYAKSNPDDMKNLVDSFKNQLIQFYIDLKLMISEYNTNDSLLSNIYSITVALVNFFLK